MIFVDASGKRLAALLPVLLFACLSAYGQPASAELQTYRLEATVPLDQIGATPAPTLPVDVVRAVQGGALEIRQSVAYTASTRRLSVRTFLVAPGSPNPTPPAGQTMLHESYEVNVENILWAAQAVVPPGTTATTLSSLVITGRVAGGSQSIFGNLANQLFVHSAGIGSGTAPTSFDNVTTVVAGTYTIYVAEATGSLTVRTGTEPGTPQPGAPTVVVTAGNNATTVLPEIQLDASGSSDPEGLPLTYEWRIIGKSAAIIGQNTAKPSVQFGEGFGEYIFEVTVTSASGLSSTGQVRVQYVGR